MISYDKTVTPGTVVKLRHSIMSGGYRPAGTPVTIVEQFSDDLFRTRFEDGKVVLMVRPQLIFPDQEKADIVKAAIDFYAEDPFTK